MHHRPSHAPGSPQSPSGASALSIFPRAFLLIASGCLSITSAQGTPPGDVQTQVTAAERAVGAAVGKQDFAALAKLWSPQMLVNSPGNRVLDREQVFASIREGKLNYEKHEGTVESFRVYGDVAVEMGHELIVPGFGPQEGKTFLRRYTNIWQQSGNSWVQIARQATYTKDSDIYAPVR
jgi:ketosteroid isomerase-like protein